MVYFFYWIAFRLNVFSFKIEVSSLTFSLPFILFAAHRQINRQSSLSLLSPGMRHTQKKIPTANQIVYAHASTIKNEPVQNAMKLLMKLLCNRPIDSCHLLRRNIQPEHIAVDIDFGDHFIGSYYSVR